MEKRTKIILIVIGIIWLIVLFFIINNVCKTLNASLSLQVDCLIPGECPIPTDKGCALGFWIFAYLVLGIPSWVLFLIVIISAFRKTPQKP